MKTLTGVAIAGTAFVVPSVAFAVSTDKGTLGYIFDTIGGLIELLIPIAFALALLAFFWGLAMYLLNFSGEDKDKKKGRDLMMYGILVLFVAASIWGIVNLLRTSFGVSKDGTVTVPEIPRGGGGSTPSAPAP